MSSFSVSCKLISTCNQLYVSGWNCELDENLTGNETVWNAFYLKKNQKACWKLELDIICLQFCCWFFYFDNDYILFQLFYWWILLFRVAVNIVPGRVILEQVILFSLEALWSFFAFHYELLRHQHVIVQFGIFCFAINSNGVYICIDIFIIWL